MDDLTTIVLAFNEEISLKETVFDLVKLEIPNHQIVISTSEMASAGCQKMAALLDSEFQNVRIYYQNKPFVAAAILELVENINSKYFIYMSADGETPALLVSKLFHEIRKMRLMLLALHVGFQVVLFKDMEQ